MRKKIVVSLVSVVVIAAAVGGFFYWRENVRLTPVEKWEIAKLSQSKDFTVIDTPRGKMVEDNQKRMKFTIPNDWTKASKDNEGGIILLSPNANMTSSLLIVEKGCKITAIITNLKTDIVTLEQELKKRFSWSSIENTKFETTKIANHNAIRNSFYEAKMKIFLDGGHIPTSKALYEIILETDEQNKENCKTIFEEVLKTLIIK